MAMNDFKVILEAMIDNSSLSTVQKQLAKERLKIKADINVEDFAKSKNEIKNQIVKLGGEIKSILGNAISDKQANQWAKQYYDQMIKGAKEVEKAQTNKNLSTQEKYYKKIIDNNKTIYSLKGKMLSADKLQEEEIKRQISLLERRNRYNNEQLNKKGLVDNTWESAVNDSLDTLENQLKLNTAKKEDVELSKKIAEINKIQNSLSVGDYDVEISTLTSKFQKWGLSVDEVKTKMSALNTAYANLQNANTDDERLKSEKEYQLALEKTNNELKLMSLNSASRTDRTNLSNKIQVWLDKNTKASKEAKIELQSYITTLNSTDDIGVPALQKIKNQFAQIEIAERSAGRLGKSFVDSIKQGMSSFATWLPATTIIMSGVNAVRDAIDNVIELDNSLLELSKVSNLSADGLVKITEEAYELGETVGKTGRQVIDAVTEFKRAGYELNDSMNMAEAALVMTNVAEGIDDTASAAGTLISVLKGYNMSESQVMSIVDKMNQASNLNPIGFDEIAEGLERTAGTMAQSGTTIDQTIGLITAGYAQLRNVEKVSTGLITLSARLRGVGEDGEVIDGLSAKLQEDFGKIGVAIEDADGNLRSIYEIAQDYANVLPTLTSKQKQYYAELAAGKRQVTVWNAITQQFQDAEKATADSVDSLNSAAEENQKYLDSISGKVSQFNSAVEQLSSTVVDSNLVKFFVDLGTTGVKAIDGIISALGGLGTIGLGAGLFAGIKNVGKRRSTMFHNCFEYADRDRCSLY